MDPWFAHGHMVDVAIVVLLGEVLLMYCLLRQRAALLALMPTLLSGLMLMVAWRLAQSGLSWPWVAVPLMASAVAHGSDLWLRWRR